METQTLFAESQQNGLFEMESQMGFSVPVSLVEEYRPKLIKDFLGLERPKKVLSALVQAPRSCAILMCGTSGSGKTTLAQAFAVELEATVWDVNSQECNVDRLREVCFHCSFVPRKGLMGYHVVICNEADCMSDAAMKFLLSKLDSSGQMKNVIWIFTCNSTERLEADGGRFVSRCLRLDFNSYGSGGEIADLLARIWSAKAGDSPAPNFKKIACGNVRESLQRLEIELLSA
jgi:DNA polymerase III gamma/tau subunit